jgi:hypothetical protein
MMEPNRLRFMSEMKRDASDGLFCVTTTDPVYGGPGSDWITGHTMRGRFSYISGSSTLTSSYEWTVTSRVCQLARTAVPVEHENTDLSSIGGNVNAAGVVNHPFIGDIAELIVYSGQPSALVDARINQYLARKWGP